MKKPEAPGILGQVGVLAGVAVVLWVGTAAYAADCSNTSEDGADIAAGASLDCDGVLDLVTAKRSALSVRFNLTERSFSRNLDRNSIPDDCESLPGFPISIPHRLFLGAESLPLPGDERCGIDPTEGTLAPCEGLC